MVTLRFLESLSVTFPINHVCTKGNCIISHKVAKKRIAENDDRQVMILRRRARVIMKSVPRRSDFSFIVCAKKNSAVTNSTIVSRILRHIFANFFSGWN